MSGYFGNGSRRAPVSIASAVPALRAPAEVRSVQGGGGEAAAGRPGFLGGAPSEQRAASAARFHVLCERLSPEGCVAGRRAGPPVVTWNPPEEATLSPPPPGHAGKAGPPWLSP